MAEGKGVWAELSGLEVEGKYGGWDQTFPESVVEVLQGLPGGKAVFCADVSSGLDASQGGFKERISGMKWRQRHRCVIFAMGLGSTISQVLSLDPVIPLKDTIPSSASLKQK